MAKVHVVPGICGFTADIEAFSEDGQMCRVSVVSDCPHVVRFAEALAARGELDAYEQVFGTFGKNGVSEDAALLRHPVCTVPAGVLKAIEAACGLALPKDCSLTIEK